MADDKVISVSIAGSGRSYEVPVSEGYTPEDVLWEVVDDVDEYSLRRGDGGTVDPGTNVYNDVDEGELLYAATDPVVG